MAVYGSQLSYFPELFRRFEYFDMKPQVSASYYPRTSLGRVRGIFQFMKKSELLRQNDVLDDTEVPALWTKQKLDLGKFVTIDDIDYRIVSSNDWLFEGGFYCFTLETFTGNSDRQEAHDYVNIGQNDYD